MQVNGKYRSLRSSSVWLRSGAVLGAEALLGLAMQWATAPLFHHTDVLRTGQLSVPSGWTLAQLVVAAATVAAWVAFAFLTISTLLTVALVPLQRVWAPLSSLDRLLGPGWWRRAVVGACGLTMAAPIAAPAAMHVAEPRNGCVVACVAGERPPSVLAGLGFPDLPDLARREPPRPRTRIVRPGDSLWRIARAELARTAPDSAICREVDALYAANRAVIGPDPNLIFPGTTLTQPGGTA